MSRRPLGLTRGAAQLLADLQGWGSTWCAVRDLCENRDPRVVLGALAELKRAGLVTIRPGRRRRQVVELTEAGKVAGL